MADEMLEGLRATLAAMSKDEVSEPDMPVAIYHQEVDTTLAFFAGDAPLHAERRRLLERRGYAPDALARLATANAASREAQARWKVTAKGRKPSEQAELEEEGRELRSEIMAAARYHLRTDSEAQGVLDDIQSGRGVADLVSDLEALPNLLVANATAFASDQDFDVQAKAARSRELAADIKAGSAEFHGTKDDSDAKDVRDRAWTHVDKLLTELRLLGRLVFRGSPEVKVFSSAYERIRRKKPAADAKTPR